jgi:hypothetical protein
MIAGAKVMFLLAIDPEARSALEQQDPFVMVLVMRPSRTWGENKPGKSSRP